jgi:hypothetical protein
MERQQHERRSKHHEAVGASGSSWAPASHSKSLAKGPRHTPRDDPPPPPPRDATPPTSEEYDDLKMRVPEIHTNHVIINYNKIDPKSIMTLCEIPCYNKSKERGTDEWFWTFFQQDWYDIVLFMKNKLNVPHAMGSL